MRETALHPLRDAEVLQGAGPPEPLPVLLAARQDLLGVPDRLRELDT